MLHINLDPFPIIQTDRLTLRKFSEADADELMAIRSNESVNTFIDRQPPANMEDVKAFIAKIENGIANNELFYWGITLKEDNMLIGTICLFKISIENKSAEIGYELLPAFQGKGIMKEAIAAIINFAFNEVKFKLLTALIKPENKRSVQLALKNNFQLDKNHEFAKQDEHIGFSTYYLLRPE